MATLSDYPYTRRITLRWNDNDVYGHVNNVEYYAFFDTVVNEYLILEGGLDVENDDAIGVVAETHCSFTASISYPGVVVAGLAVERLGNSSVRYMIGLFDGKDDADDPPLLAEGWFVHVFVDRQSRRPKPIPDGLRATLEVISR
jgi:acyl-CoA thioester hydrolase